MARIQTLIKNIYTSLFDTSGKDLLSLPERIKNELSLSLSGDEKIIVSMKTDRVIYRAGLSRDSNTFYKTFAVLTSKRLIIAKNSTSLKIFRDFQLSQVNSLLYEEIASKPTIHVDIVNSKYVLSMPPGSFAEAKTFFETFNSFIEPGKLENNFCSTCGNKIQTDSVYCSHCGKKI